MEKQKILIVDDDSRIRNLLKIYLEKADFQVLEAENGLEALLALQNTQPNLIVLDIMMPVLDGMETCRQIRKLTTTPILLLTARTEADDKLLAFDSGADDYVEKPFNPQEVVARVRAILRRRNALPPPFKQAKAPAMLPVVQHGSLLIDPASRSVRLDGAEKELTAKEFDLLHTLASRPGHVFSREHLLQSVWGIDNTGDSRTVDIHIQRLRQKIGDDGGPGWKIATVWGVGYRFEITAPKESRL
jgi:DNA-binding response OmpR family regulator